MVSIDSLGKAAAVERQQRTACDEVPRKVPRCTAAQLWAKAIASGFEPKIPAQIQWDTHLGVWMFSGHRGDESTYVALLDDCTPGATVAAVPRDVRRIHAAPETTGDPFDDDKPGPARPAPPAPPDPPSGSFMTTTDMAAFDPMAFIANARTLARRLESDAELIELDFTVGPDGKAASGGRYRFRSAHRGIPAQPPQSHQCMIDVELNAYGNVTTARTYDEWCTQDVVGAPHCTFKQIWDKASSKRTEPSPSRLRWDASQWAFDGVVDGNYHTFRFRDDCK